MGMIFLKGCREMVYFYIWVKVSMVCRYLFVGILCFEMLLKMVVLFVCLLNRVFMLFMWGSLLLVS